MFAEVHPNKTFRVQSAVVRETTYTRGFGSDVRERNFARANSCGRAFGI